MRAAAQQKHKDFRAGDTVELIFVPKPDDYNGQGTIQLVIKDLRLVE